MSDYWEGLLVISDVGETREAVMGGGGRQERGKRDAGNEVF